MKRFLSFLMVFALLFVFIGCNKQSGNETQTKDPTPKTEVPTEKTPEEKTFEVSFVTNCETTAEKQTVKKATEISLPNLTKEGYTFKGFYLDSEFKTKFSQSTYVLNSDITLYALFEINTYIVNFKVDGNIVSGQFVEHGSAAEKPNDPAKEGYVFKGWDQDFSNVTSDLTINALFDAAAYTVTFKNGDEVLDTQNVTHGQSATAPAEPTKTGFVFNGWDKDFSNVTSDLVVNAKFKAQTFTVNFKMTEDSEYYYDIQEVEYGEDAEEPDAPTRPGFQFKGWDKEFTNVTSDLIVTATWEVKTYVVKYVVDGVVYQEVTVEHGKDPIPPADPSKDGYEFTGWDKTPTEVTYDGIVVTAQFAAKSFNIKYYNGTTELDLQPKTYKVGDDFDLPQFEESGYIFAGWYLDSEFKTSSIGRIEPTQTGELALYALNVKVDFGSYLTSWSFSGFDGTNTVAKGIDAVSDLPEQYEKDFYTYLSTNNHLNDSRLASTMKVTNWEEFSRVNPNHNGDPQRIWNDTSTNYVGGADGYSALFLFDELVLDSNGLLEDIKGGFLGTEPYKTKYWNLTYSLVQMVQYKYNTTDFHVSSAVNNGFFAFVIDGYFYGTQGASDGTFKALRSVCPTTTTYYKVENGTAVAYTREYTNTTDLSSLNRALAIPSCDGKAFVGWYLDSELTKSVLDNPPTQHCTLYAKFE